MEPNWAKLSRPANRRKSVSAAPSPGSARSLRHAGGSEPGFGGAGFASVRTPKHSPVTGGWELDATRKGEGGRRPHCRDLERPPRGTGRSERGATGARLGRRFSSASLILKLGDSGVSDKADVGLKVRRAAGCVEGVSFRASRLGVRRCF